MTFSKAKPNRTAWLLFACFAALFLTLFFAISFYLRSELPQVHDPRGLSSNLGFFFFINLLIIGVMVLGFFVFKNLSKQVIDRRRGILGSRLRSRLIAAFVALSLVPSVLLFFVAKGILESVLQGWFSPQVAASVDGGVALAKHHYELEEERLYRNVRFLSRRATELFPYLGAEEVAQAGAEKQRSVMRHYLEEKRREYGLFQLALVDASGKIIVEAQGLELRRGDISVPGPNLAALKDAAEGSIVVRPEQSIDGEFLRAYAPIIWSRLTGVVGETFYHLGPDGLAPSIEVGTPFRLLATQRTSPEMNAVLAKIIDAYDDYRELKTYKRPIASSYVLQLVMVTLMVVLAAIWVGFYLARSISVPIQMLADGTVQIAQGNLSYRIPELGDDELSVLVHSFNTMTADLEHTTEELISRRRYIETILASLGVGVLSIDTDGRLTTVNQSASDILGLSQPEQVTKKPYAKVLPGALAEQLANMLEDLVAGSEKLSTGNSSLYIGGQSKQLKITVSSLMSAEGDLLGAVVLLDDLTELVSAQRMAAWQEVAKRIAHEIKNPLTPIQLSAQRLQKRFRQKHFNNQGETITNRDDYNVVTSCTDTIAKQVELLRVLVNEFSQFARLPKAHPESLELGDLIEETLSMYRQAHSEIAFSHRLARDFPVMELDREQFRRVFINLLDNAVSSIKGREEAGASFDRKITIVSSVDWSLDLVSVAITDTGLGISDSDKQKVFEPYFSTKGSGTGLGLSIVSTIVADHNGFIRVRDTEPQGATFIIELPVTVTAARSLA